MGAEPVGCLCPRHERSLDAQMVEWKCVESLGGSGRRLSEVPAAVSWDQNRIDCFIRGADNELWHKWTWLG